MSGASTSSAAATGTRRLASLDGLRGWAAIVVVLHHTLEIAKPYLAPAAGDPVVVGSLWWWLTQTPLKLASAGGEAVVVFFVLSGVVVALPALRATGPFSWGAFLASRFVRIYLPVWGALLLSAALIELVPRKLSKVVEGSWLADSNATTVHGSILFDEATLSRYSFDIVNTLWSLRWEMVFAVLLPLYVVVARLVRRRWAAVGALAAGVAIAGFALTDGTLSYLPAFFLGTLVAANLDRYRAWAEERSRSRWFRPIAGAAGLACAACLIASWLARPVAPAGSVPSLALTGLSVLGAVGLVLLALAPTGIAAALSARVSQGLGRMSFSLYLVHVPLLATVGFLLGDSHWGLVALVGIPVSLAVAWLFQRTIEAPAHRLARRIGKTVADPSRRISRDLTPAREARA